MGAIAVAGANTASAQVYFNENFDGLTLEPYVDEIPDEDDPRDEVWSPTGPAGWSVDRSGVPAGGVTEWRGWNFVDPIWWNEVAGQDRGNFALPEQGFVVAVADGDEWLDASTDGDTMVSFMSTPSIPLAGVASGTSISFESSWRAEDAQYGVIRASFDGAAPVELMRLDSNPESDNYYPDENPGVIDVSVAIPNGAQNVVFSWGYSGSDDWWWAVDNISFGNYSEDFEGVQLGQNVMEGRVLGLWDPDAVYTHNPPPGWSDDGVPFYEDEGIGVTEWKGWSFC